MGKNRGVTSCFHTPHGTPDGTSGDASAPDEEGGGRALAERDLATRASALTRVDPASGASTALDVREWVDRVEPAY